MSPVPVHPSSHGPGGLPPACVETVSISHAEATYRLAKCVNGIAHWARVTTSVDSAPQDGVSVAEDAFA
jgi:hypothetical protein